jgi:hypothetical protein
MNSGAGDTTQLVPGFPIRTPWDHSSVDSSPRPIAASHVLHRLLVPRHPPSALSNLTTKMLASTVQFSTNNHPHHKAPNTPHRAVLEKDAGDHPEQNRKACSFRTQQGVCLTPKTSRIHHGFPHPQKEGRTHHQNRCRDRLASVSADEHPTPTQLGDAGSLPTFAGRCSLERR